MDRVPTVPTLEHLCRVTVELAIPMSMGATPLGERRVIPIVGGQFTGARLAGEVLAGGADWQLVRPDGAALLDARYTLRTNDGALIYVSNRGLRRGPREVLERLVRGEDVDPASYYFRTVPAFETGSERYAWLNDMISVCSGIRTANSVILEMYTVL